MSEQLAPTTSTLHQRHGSSIGQPLTRRDGHLKVTGTATFAADNHPAGMLYAVIATASIARGTVTSLDVDAAKAHPGVVDVMTPNHKPALAQDPDEKNGPFVFRLDLLQNDTVRYANQAIAVVIAESLEAATEAAALLSPTYDIEPARMSLDDANAIRARDSITDIEWCSANNSTPCALRQISIPLLITAMGAHYFAQRVLHLAVAHLVEGKVNA